MLKCWEEEPRDRPTFLKLKETMKEIERNHEVSSKLYAFKIQLTKKSCVRRTMQPRINLLALIVATTLAQAIHVPVGNLNINKPKFIARLTL